MHYLVCSFWLFLQFEKFVSILTSNVVDSNMLIRCLVLSQEHFMTDRFFSGKVTIFPQNLWKDPSLEIYKEDPTYLY